MKTYYYGGKFNPFTKGHASVLRNLVKCIKSDPDHVDNDGTRIVVGVKSRIGAGCEAGCADFGARYGMVGAGIDELRKELGPEYDGIDIQVTSQNKDRTWDYLNSSPSWLPKDWKENKSVTIVMGRDEYDDMMESLAGESDKWHHPKEIKAACDVMRYPRDPIVSSTRVREIFRANPFVPYCDVSDYLSKPVYDYIVDNRLYWQYGREESERQQENQFLHGYDMTKFPRPSCTATVLAHFRDDVLLVRRKGHPFRGFWALPGGFFDVDKDYTLEETAARELEEETGLVLGTGRFRQFHTFSEKGLDPRGRIVDTVFTVELTEGDDEDPELDPKAGDDAAEVSFWPVDKLPRMAFHHREVIEAWKQKTEKKEVE